MWAFKQWPWEFESPNPTSSVLLILRVVLAIPAAKLASGITKGLVLLSASLKCINYHGRTVIGSAWAT